MRPARCSASSDGERGEALLAPLLQGAPARARGFELAREHDEPHGGAHDGRRERQGHVHGRAALVRQALELQDERRARREPRAHAHHEHRRVERRLLHALHLRASSTVMPPIFCTASDTDIHREREPRM